MANVDFERRHEPKEALLTAIAAVLLCTGALGLVAWARPGQAVAAFHWWLVAVSAIAVAAVAWVATGTLGQHRRSAFDAAQERGVGPPIVPERLATLDRLVTVVEWDRREFRSRLRPLLVNIATQRLATYRAIDLESEPELARATLGEPVWTLLTEPMDAAPADGPGISPAQLRSVIEVLEGLDEERLDRD